MTASAPGDKPIFILGVGCQKGGTTWLANYLARHPAITMARPKEFHVFDAAMLPEAFGSWRMRHRLDRENPLSPARWLPAGAGRASPSLLFRMIMDERRYLQFFLRLAEEHRIVGEITPTYAALPPGALAAIRGLLEPHFDLRIIYLLRDPIDRLFSQIRMIEQRAARTRTSPAERFADGYDLPVYEIWGDYARAVRNLEAAFGADRVFVELFERLFNDETIRALCEFLGVEFVAGRYAQARNPSPPAAPPSARAIAAAREHYAWVYAFCAERFGEDIIRSLWKNY